MPSNMSISVQQSWKPVSHISCRAASHDPAAFHSINVAVDHAPAAIHSTYGVVDHAPAALHSTYGVVDHASAALHSSCGSASQKSWKSYIESVGRHRNSYEITAVSSLLCDVVVVQHMSRQLELFIVHTETVS